MLEAELEGQAASGGLRGVVLEPLAPRSERQVLKHRVVPVPLCLLRQARRSCGRSIFESDL